MDSDTLELTGKFSLNKLYERIGFNKEIISRGRFAELNAAEQRPFRCVSVAFMVTNYCYHSELIPDEFLYACTNTSSIPCICSELYLIGAIAV